LALKKLVNKFTAEEKIAKNHPIPIKSKNSLPQSYVPHAWCSSDRFDFYKCEYGLSKILLSYIFKINYNWFSWQI